MIQPQPSAKAEWYEAIIEAELVAGYQFSPELQNYLILTLDEFTQNQAFSPQPIAIEFLEYSTANTFDQLRHLRSVGDQCLLLSGLFPNRAEKKHVSLNYFIRVGQESYRCISTYSKPMPLDPKLFQQLSTNFIGLMDILHHLRLTYFKSS